MEPLFVLTQRMGIKLITSKIRKILHAATVFILLTAFTSCKIYERKYMSGFTIAMAGHNKEIQKKVSERKEAKLTVKEKSHPDSIMESKISNPASAPPLPPRKKSVKLKNMTKPDTIQRPGFIHRTAHVITGTNHDNWAPVGKKTNLSHKKIAPGSWISVLFLFPGIIILPGIGLAASAYYNLQALLHHFHEPENYKGKTLSWILFGIHLFFLFSAVIVLIIAIIGFITILAVLL